MHQTNKTAELRIKIAKYRAMARLTTDRETAQRIHGLADELQIQVQEIENEHPRCGVSSPDPK